MKKKLIAIVASLAMVATMVPASAFAATGAAKAVSATDINIKLQDTNALSSVGATYWNTVYDQILDEDPANGDPDSLIEPFGELSAHYSNGVMKLSGSLPYIKSANTTAKPSQWPEVQKAGHFAQFTLEVKNPHDAADNGTDKKVLVVQHEQCATDGANGVLFNAYKVKTHTFSTTNDLLLPYALRLEDPSYMMSVYYLTDAAYTKFNTEIGTNGNEFMYGDASIADKAGAKYKGTKAQLDTLLNGKAEDGTPYVIASQDIRVDKSGLTLLSEQETKTYVADKKAVKGFVDAVTKDAASTSIKRPDNTNTFNLDEKDEVNADYRTKTVEARAKYTGLTTAQKAIVDNAAKDSAEKEAYDGLLEAEKNVASYDQIPDISALIAALPTKEKMDVTNEAQVKQVKDVEAAVKALREGVQKVLLNPAKNNYLTQSQIDKYNAVLTMVNTANAQAVIKAINALPTLPTTEFADKAAIDAAFVPMNDAEKAYKALTDGEKTAVTNYPVLQAYQANYNKLIKAYVDPIWEAAAKIKLSDETPLTEEEIALITELKAYVDGKYIDTANIDQFNPDTYDALVAALNKIEKDAKSLANAEVTVAGADSIVYDGTKKTPAVTVTIGGKEVAADAYDTIYSDNKDAGEATITIIPKDESGYTGKKEVAFTIKPAALTADMVKVANATYTGKAVKPAVSVKGGVDYTVAYKNNTAVGKASAVVTGTGNYTGTITKNFIVKPAKESITSLKAGKKQITVAYKAQTGAKYRVICKASGLKAIGTNTTATKKTVKKLKSGKTYQVKVRAYKAVDGTTYYGAYSAVKKVKVK